MKMAIIGSRTFDNYEYMKSMLKWHEITMIISGGAKGADSLAQKYATEHNLPFKCFPAEWDKFGKSAGFIRNKQIVQASEEIIAFWDGKSKGTANSIKIAEEAGKPVYIYWPTVQNEADQILQRIG